MRARGVRAGIDRAAVVATAVRLADADGLQSVTVARLAAELGIRPPSLYNHVAGHDELQRELALLGIRELGQRMGRAAMGKATDDALRALAVAYRDVAREHPGLYAASLRAPDPADAALTEASTAVIGVVLAVLAGYGLGGDDALHAVRALRSVLHGFVALEALGGFGLPLDLDESFQRLVDGFIAGLRRAQERPA